MIPGRPADLWLMLVSLIVSKFFHVNPAAQKDTAPFVGVLAQKATVGNESPAVLRPGL